MQLEASKTPPNPELALTDDNLYKSRFSAPSPTNLVMNMEPRQQNNWFLCPSSWSVPVECIPDWVWDVDSLSSRSSACGC